MRSAEKRGLRAIRPPFSVPTHRVKEQSADIGVVDDAIELLGVGIRGQQRGRESGGESGGSSTPHIGIALLHRETLGETTPRTPYVRATRTRNTAQPGLATFRGTEHHPDRLLIACRISCRQVATSGRCVRKERMQTRIT